MRIKITSLGCRLNQSEIESVSTVLQDRGHSIVSSDNADIFIINSCAVTGKSEAKVRNIVSRALAAENKSAKIFVTGCSTDEFRNNPRVNYISNDYKYLIPEIIEENKSINDLQISVPSRFDYSPPVKSSTVRTNLKIQDGCDNFCSYCIIPYMRGAPLSRDAGTIIKDFNELTANGYKEIILTGVNIGKYRNGSVSLSGLISRILESNSFFRLHLTSLDPHSADDELINLYKDPRMVKHLHLSLQSGSDSVLSRMNRPYKRSHYIEVTEKIKTLVEDFNFTTDVIVGFPGETEEEFNETLTISREVGFSHIHTFRYSPRPGTKAYSFKDSVNGSIKKKRSKTITDLAMELKKEYYIRFNNRKTLFLSEKGRGDITPGFNEYYIPVEVTEKIPANQFYNVTTVFNDTKYNLTGEILSDESIKG
jgi:threonylcarbamoyladenosine tRNA methylthiotransferase MtaB